VTHEDGSQAFLDDPTFQEIYEVIPDKRGPGRPPLVGKAEAVATVEPIKRRRRHRRTRPLTAA